MKICRTCGELHNRKSDFCSHNCYKMDKYKKNFKSLNYQKKEHELPNKASKSIEEINMEANKIGLSYGKYVNRYGL